MYKRLLSHPLTQKKQFGKNAQGFWETQVYLSSRKKKKGQHSKEREGGTLDQKFTLICN